MQGPGTPDGLAKVFLHAPPYLGTAPLPKKRTVLIDKASWGGRGAFHWLLKLLCSLLVLHAPRVQPSVAVRVVPTVGH